MLLLKNAWFVLFLSSLLAHNGFSNGNNDLEFQKCIGVFRGSKYNAALKLPEFIEKGVWDKPASANIRNSLEGILKVAENLLTDRSRSTMATLSIAETIIHDMADLRAAIKSGRIAIGFNSTSNEIVGVAIRNINHKRRILVQFGQGASTGSSSDLFFIGEVWRALTTALEKTRKPKGLHEEALIYGFVRRRQLWELMNLQVASTDPRVVAALRIVKTSDAMRDYVSQEVGEDLSLLNTFDKIFRKIATSKTPEKVAGIFNDQLLPLSLDRVDAFFAEMHSDQGISEKTLLETRSFIAMSASLFDLIENIQLSIGRFEQNGATAININLFKSRVKKLEYNVNPYFSANDQGKIFKKAQRFFNDENNSKFRAAFILAVGADEGMAKKFEESVQLILASRNENSLVNIITSHLKPMAESMIKALEENNQSEQAHHPELVSRAKGLLRVSFAMDELIHLVANNRDFFINDSASLPYSLWRTQLTRIHLLIGSPGLKI